MIDKRERAPQFSWAATVTLLDSTATEGAEDPDACPFGFAAAWAAKPR